MAIDNFKNIEKNKGYYVTSKDRTIFETGLSNSVFGSGDSDIIEFVLYDVNDNQLPQGDNGDLVRYIPLTDANIRDYIVITDKTEHQQMNFPKEYFIDVEKLIKEAGYDNGIFKTQISLLNRRVGSNSPQDKLWIHEISPSRTEIRVIPIQPTNEKVKEDLNLRYNILIEDGDYRDDTKTVVNQFIETISENKAIENIFYKLGDDYLPQIKKEFKIGNIDEILKSVAEKFREAATYEFSGRISKITDVNYGKPSPEPTTVELSVSYIKQRCQTILKEIISTYIPTREVDTTYVRPEDEKLVNETKEILNNIGT